MDVILLKDVEKVGLRGDVVSVTRGYARNFLFPRSLAEEATKARVAELQKREAQRARHEARTVEEAQQIAAKIGKAVLRFEVKAGERGVLFGSVTPTDIADELWKTEKIRVDRRKIGTGNLKRVGRYEIPIDIFQDVAVSVRAEIVPEGGELPSEDVLASWDEAERAEEEAATEARAHEEPVYEDEPAPAPAAEADGDAAEESEPAQQDGEPVEAAEPEREGF